MSINFTENHDWNLGEGSPRRSHPFVSRLGIGLLSFFSNLTDAGGGGSYSDPYSQPPKDEDIPIPDDKCCNLARPDRECKFTGDKSNFTCPEGFQKTFWPCCEGTRIIGCGECASGPSCFDAPWDCSIWWWTDSPC